MTRRDIGNGMVMSLSLFAGAVYAAPERYVSDLSSARATVFLVCVGLMWLLGCAIGLKLSREC